jgi:hypothetical protein
MDVKKRVSADDYQVEHVETTSNNDGKSDEVGILGDGRAAAERRLVRKLDTRLLPTIVVIFIMNYIDVSIFLTSYIK